MNIAVIPARGGSKRIPGKNIKEFCGKSIICYSIETALKSKIFDKIIVSTDDDQIAKIALQAGAEIPFIRPREISDDNSVISEVLIHAIQHFNKKGSVDNVCCIYSTAPFIRSKDIIRGYEKLKSKDSIQFVLSATSYAFPIQRAIRIDSNGGVVPFDAASFKKRSQDLTEVYHDAGQFCWAKANAYLNKLQVFADHTRIINLPRYRVIDIDTLEDWEMAEYMYKAIHY